MRIAVLGPGGVGGLVAAALARAGEETIVIAREPTAAALAQRGLSVRSVALGDFEVPVQGQPRLEEPVDVLLVATKATGLSDGLARIAAGAPALVVPLLNGLEHMALLRERFGSGRVTAGVIRVESDRPATGEIVQTSPTVRIDLAISPDGTSGAVRELGGALERAGLQVRVGDVERQVLWSKLARLNALALTTGASDQPIGYVRGDPRWRSALEGAINETVAVANADGAQLDAAATLAELDQAHAELGSSMRRDIAAGREPELDAIAGSVLRAGARHGLRCQTVQWLAERVAARAGIEPPQAG
jgi:2-dehydropantoate 2-reductase